MFNYLAPSLLAAISLTGAVAAQSSELTPQMRSAVVEEVAALYRANYHDRTRGEEIAAGLMQAEDDGAYDTYSSAEALASALSEAVADYDRHAHVYWSDDEDEEIEAHHSDDWDEASRRLNHGVERVERLPGNIGLVRLRMLSHPDVAAATVDGVFSILENADALIIDLRANGGGDPEAVTNLASYLLGPDPQTFHTVYWADRNETEIFTTTPHHPRSRLYDVPLVILTTAATGSAAEIFVHGMKRADRGVVIGQATYGARNPGRYFPAAHGFHAFVSYGRPGDADQDLSWSAGGIEPHMATEGGQELAVAMEYLWDELLPGADHDQRERIAFARERLRALAEPTELTPEQRAELVALYGSREVIGRDGELFYRRDRRPLLRMIPAGNDRFFVEEFSEFRIDFVRNEAGQIVRMDVPYNDGHTEPNNRTD